MKALFAIAAIWIVVNLASSSLERWVRTQFQSVVFLQNDGSLDRSTSCWVKCFAVCGELWGTPVAVEDLSKLAPDIASLADLELVASKCGWTNRCVNIEYRGLVSHLSGGGFAILHCHGDHFVLAMIDKDCLLLVYDPGKGIFRVDAGGLYGKDFEWEGLSLLLSQPQR